MSILADIPNLSSHLQSTIEVGFLIGIVVVFLLALCVDVVELPIWVAILLFFLYLGICTGLSELIYHAQWIDYRRSLWK